MKMLSRYFLSKPWAKTQSLTMVEIALAIAIIGIALLSLFGLMGIALDTARDANDENQIGILVARMVEDRRASPFGESSQLYAVTNLNIMQPDFPLIPSGGNTVYFSKNGNPLTTSVGAYYQVRIAVSNFNAGIGPPAPAAQFNLRVEWPANAAKTNVNYFSTIIARDKP